MSRRAWVTAPLSGMRGGLGRKSAMSISSDMRACVTSLAEEQGGAEDSGI